MRVPRRVKNQIKGKTLHNKELKKTKTPFYEYTSVKRKKGLDLIKRISIIKLVKKLIF